MNAKRITVLLAICLGAAWMCGCGPMLLNGTPIGGSGKWDGASGATQEELVAKLVGDMVTVPGDGIVEEFSLCKYEVTQDLWYAVMGYNISKHKGADLPVDNVSMAAIETFLTKLNALPEVSASGKPFRLPTKAEFGLACQAGGDGPYGRLADGTEVTEATLEKIAWYKVNSGGQTHPVGTKEPNAYGLYDMNGNVEEWWEPYEFRSGAWQMGAAGGSWDSPASRCTATSSKGMLYMNHHATDGLRLAR